MERHTTSPLNGQLLYPLSEHLRSTLDEERIGDGEVLLCTPTDIDWHGRYTRQWLVLTRDRLLVLGDEETGAAGKDGRAADPVQPVLVSLPLEKVSEFRLQPGVGSGLLTARVDGVFVDVLRYSNREAYRFERVVQKLEKHRQGEAFTITGEDEHDPRRCAKCGMMLDSPGDSCSYCVSRGAVLWRMVRLMGPYKGSAAAMMSLLLVGVALDLVSPQLTRYLVDEVFMPASTGAAAGQEVDRGMKVTILMWIVGILAGVQVLRMIVNIFNGRLASRVGTAITFDMRGRLVDHLQRLSIGFYDKQQVGSLVGRVAYDTESLHGFVWQLTGGFLLQIVMVIGVGIMMFSIDSELAFYALLPAPLVMGATVFFWKYIYPRYYRTWDASSKQAGALSGMLSGVRVIKAFSQEDRELQRFNASSTRLRASRHGVDAAIGTFNPAVGLIFQLGGWIVWYAGGRDVLDGRLTLGELMAFFGYLWMFYGPLAALPQFTNWLTQFVTQANRIFEILDTPVAIADAAEPQPIGAMRGEIEFENVTFGYNRHTPILRGVSLHIRPGEMIGIVGQSGSGKSTLVNLICRFYDVDDGKVKIDGIDVRQVSKQELRSQIGMVLQEPFIFRGSIVENIAYGRPDSSPEEILTASRAANCHDFIIRQVHGYDTWVGERGAGLSGGERQRVSLARVLLTHPRVLILDEATSSVDAESEAAIQTALHDLVKGRTTIAIAHRLSTLRRADRIIVMHHGRIAEMGSHEELLERRGIYSRLVRLQGTPTHIDADALDLSRTDDARDETGCQTRAAADTDGPSPLPPIDSHHIRWLDPSFARIHRGTYNMLHVTIRNDRIYGGIFAVRCMPVKHPGKYISLRYISPEGGGQEHEVGIIRDLDEWSAEAQDLVHETLGKRYFVHSVRAIDDIRQTGNYIDFRVVTDRGPMRFTVRAQSDRVQDYGPRGKMILDTDENRYLITDVEMLNDREQRLFRRHIYW
jgi:ATP-binding cassette, subfamily B, bacterial